MQKRYPSYPAVDESLVYTRKKFGIGILRSFSGEELEVASRFNVSSELKKALELRREMNMNALVYRVYWTDEADVAHYKDHSDIGAMLASLEELRRNPLYSFVTSVSHNPNSVGKPGVAPPPSDYSWTKRRTTELRKPVISTDNIEVPLDDE